MVFHGTCGQTGAMSPLCFYFIYSVQGTHKKLQGHIIGLPELTTFVYHKEDDLGEVLQPKREVLQVSGRAHHLTPLCQPVLHTRSSWNMWFFCSCVNECFNKTMLYLTQNMELS